LIILALKNHVRGASFFAQQVKLIRAKQENINIRYAQ